MLNKLEGKEKILKILKQFEETNRNSQKCGTISEEPSNLINNSKKEKILTRKSAKPRKFF